MQDNGRRLNARIQEQSLYYRSLVPSDLEALRAAHQALFPIDYEDSFYQAAVRAEQGIVSIAAVSRNGAKEELAGFLTARVCSLRECDTTDRVLLGLNSTLVDAYNALYILTVGVLEPVRHRGIGSKLLAAILEQAKERSCYSVYLHVIDYNAAAIAFYKRNRALRVLGVRAPLLSLEYPDDAQEWQAAKSRSNPLQCLPETAGPNILDHSRHIVEYAPIALLWKDAEA